MKRIPVLTAKDMHKGATSGPKGTRCLFGWCWKIADNPDERRLLDRSIEDETGHETVGFNDAPHRRKSTLAAVWNRAMKRLGYVVSPSGKYFVKPK